MIPEDDTYLSPEDEAAAFRARAEEAKRRWQEREARLFWKGVLDSEVGRREIWRLLNDLNTFRTEFKAAPNGAPDERATWFWHGRSTFGFDFYQHLSVCAREGVAKMHIEHDVRYSEFNEEVEP